MDVNTISQPSTVSRANEASATGTGTMISADFQTFLAMMTAQLRNQDPLNPMESTEFATQLAQFSGVEQQVRSNELLQGLQASMATMGMSELGGWIGMDARAEMPAQFNGRPVTLAGPQNVLADRMELVVSNQRGEAVQRLPIPLSDEPFQWNGTGTNGETLPHGTYTFSVQNWNGENMLDEQDAMVIARVQEAQLSDGEIWLTMADGVRIPAANVIGLRAPGA